MFLLEKLFIIKIFIFLETILYCRIQFQQKNHIIIFKGILFQPPWIIHVKIINFRNDVFSFYKNIVYFLYIREFLKRVYGLTTWRNVIKLTILSCSLWSSVIRQLAVYLKTIWMRKNIWGKNENIIVASSVLYHFFTESFVRIYNFFK